MRRWLERHQLLDLREATVFSDEVGAPKPEPRPFRAALQALGVEVAGVVHVGDLRRSAVAGTKRVGMRTVRIRAHHDDADGASKGSPGVIDCAAAGCDPVCERPEADVVVDSFEELLRLVIG